MVLAASSDSIKLTTQRNAVSLAKGKLRDILNLLHASKCSCNLGDDDDDDDDDMSRWRLLLWTNCATFRPLWKKMRSSKHWTWIFRTTRDQRSTDESTTLRDRPL